MSTSLRLLLFGLLGIITTILVIGCTLDSEGTSKSRSYYLLTLSQDERDYLTSSAGYKIGRFEGFIYPPNTDVPPEFANIVVPFYRLYHQDIGDHFYTTNLEERNNAVAAGYVDDNYCHIYENMDEPCDPSVAALIIPNDYIPAVEGGTAFYRLFSPGAKDHLYTTSEKEREYALKNGYINDGTPVVGGIYPYDPEKEVPEGSVKFYRLFNEQTGDHLYTTSKDEVSAAKAAGYVDDNYCHLYEDMDQPCDPSFAGYISTEDTSETIPLFRIYNPTTGDHFYTTSEKERQLAIDYLGYQDDDYCHKYEGVPLSDGCVSIAGYVFQVQMKLAPLYRLFHHTVGDHFYTTSLYAKIIKALVPSSYTDEGVAGYLFEEQVLNTEILYHLCKWNNQGAVAIDCAKAFEP